MTDTYRLKKIIDSSGFRIDHIAKELNLSRQGLYNKINNRYEFKTSEVEKICKLLGISSLKEKERIFYARKDDLKSSNKVS